MGCRIAEGLKDEWAQVRARMWDDEVQRFKVTGAEVDDVEIERARRVVFVERRSAAFDLEFLEATQEIERRDHDGIELDLSDGIEERRCAGNALDRVGLEAWRLADFAIHGHFAEEVDAGLKLGVAIPHVGTEGNAYEDVGHGLGLKKSDPAGSGSQHLRVHRLRAAATN